MTATTHLSRTFPAPFQSGGKVSSRLDPVVDQAPYRWSGPLNGPPFRFSGRACIAGERDSFDSSLYREIAVESPIKHTESMQPPTHVPALRRSRRRRVSRSWVCLGAKTRNRVVRPLGTIRALGDGISRDPIGTIASANIYAVVDNNPLRSSDYLGLFRNPINWLCDKVFDAIAPPALKQAPPRPTTDNNTTYKGDHVIVTTAFAPSDTRDLRWHVEPGTDNGTLKMSEIVVDCCGDCSPIKCSISFSANVVVYKGRPVQADGMLIPASHVYGHEQKHYKSLLTYSFEVAKQMSEEKPPVTPSELEQKYAKLLFDYLKQEQDHANPDSPGTYEPVPPELYPNWNYEKQQEDLGTGI
jgi:hypothetical protein